MNIEDVSKPYYTFALGQRGPGKALTWCQFERHRPDGGFDFHVISGGWYGVYRDGEVFLDNAGELSWLSAQIVWVGTVPRKLSFDYNRALAWIEEQIAVSSNG